MIDKQKIKWLVIFLAAIIALLATITGFTVAENESNETIVEEIIDETTDIAEEDVKTIVLKETNETQGIVNETIEFTEEEIKTIVLNETTESVELDKTITINLEYKEDSIYDIDNDGIEQIPGIVDLTVENAQFNWDVNEENLCTKWETYSVEDEESTTVCYGSEQCCSFVHLTPQMPLWNRPFYSAYGVYGATFNNLISAQILYVDYDLSADEPFADIAYSDVKELKAEFLKPVIIFKNICIDTCLLSGFNATSYKLIFVIEDATLRLDSLRYSTVEDIDVSENAPELVTEIRNITIYKNQDEKIDLSAYFTDKDGDILTYFFHETDNLNVVIKDSVARIVPDYNYTGKNYVFVTTSDGYYNATSNVFFINIIERPFGPSEVNVSESLIKPRIVINKPVRWVKMVNSSGRVINLSINISSDALNVTVRDVKENRIISEDKLKINDKGVIKNYSIYRAEKRIGQIEKIEDKLNKKKLEVISETPFARREISSINRELVDLENERNILTGYVVAAKGKGVITRFFEWLFDVEITAYVVAELTENEINVTSVIIEDIVEEVEIVYYTEAPISEEENITNGKRIVISSDVHYEDILAYTYLSIEATENAVHLYHLVDNVREEVSIDKYDLNDNSLIDYIEWIVPSLSNQTYELVIEISAAEHLDENKTFISDIYNETYQLDDIWGEPIYHNEYVRVTFKRNLTSDRDITVYVRNTQQFNTIIEVYYFNSEEKITEFPVIIEEKYYKVYLTGMQGSHDVFDLKIKNLNSDKSAFLEFDHIIDPQAEPGGEVELRPQTCNSESKAATKYLYDKVCDGSYPGNCPAGGGTDYLSCNDANSETNSYNANSYGGYLANFSNTLITNCDTVTEVFLCWEWWVSSIDPTGASIEVDANNGASFTVVNTTLPGSSANPGLYCQNVTADEIWTCGVFFSSGNAAMARNYVTRTSGGGPDTITVDALFFNVTYTETPADTIKPSFSVAQTNATATTPTINDVIQLNLTVSDSGGVSVIRLATNVSGTMQNDSTYDIIAGGSSSATAIFNFTVTANNTVIQWQVWANDSSSNANSNASLIRTFVVQNTVPTTPNIIYPVDGKNYTNITAINYSSGDADGDSLTYNIYINNTLNSTLTDVNLTDWNASDGFYNLTVTATDGKDTSANSTVVNFRLDSVAPSWSGNETNASSITYNGTDVQINLTISDSGAGIDFYRLTTNDTSDGVWVNETIVDFNGASVTAIFNYSIHNFSDSGGTLGWNVWSNDSAGNVNISQIYTLVVQDKAPPGFSNAQTNASSTTYNGTDVQINLTITDTTAVDFYRIATNNTDGNVMANQSLIDAGGVASLTAIFNESIAWFPATGGTLGWQVWANDNLGNTNVSQIYTLTVEEKVTDSCSCPGSGDWNIIGGDECSLEPPGCNIVPNKFRVLNGKMRILSGAYLRAGGCYVANDQSLHVDDNGGLYCEG